MKKKKWPDPTGSDWQVGAAQLPRPGASFEEEEHGEEAGADVEDDAQTVEVPDPETGSSF